MTKTPDDRRLELLHGTLDMLVMSLTQLFKADAGAQSISTMPRRHLSLNLKR